MIDYIWYSVPKGRLSQDFEDSMTGRDLWLCINGRVYSGFRLSGFKEGWYLKSTYQLATAELGTPTHIMLRDYPPDPPTWDLPFQG